MKFCRRNICIFLVSIGIIFLFSGCNKSAPSFNEGVDTSHIEQKEDSNLSQVKPLYTVADIKKEYAKNGSEENKYMFKPFYNVEQTTEFTFHFNSNVDPVKAITVHTDSKCEENSTVYQINDGYKTVSGVDVVVKPYRPVLKTENRLDGSEENIWGYAPIYYLCIRYDLDANEVTKLEEPIVIPFTIINKISTPNAYANIDNRGIFSIKWLPIENAVSYRIYTAKSPDNKKLSRAECAYVSDFLKLIETVPASSCEYRNDKELTEDILGKKKEYVRYQNSENSRYTFYITAVDAQGNESFFSKPVGIWQYEDVLPYTVTNEHLGIGSNYWIEEFLEKVSVTAVDDKTVQDYPINYYRNGEPSTSRHICEYRYEIVGTALTGTVSYYNLENDFPESHMSSIKIQTGMKIDIPREEISPVDVNTIVDSDYDEVRINLAGHTSYPENAKIKYDPASLLIRTDMEAARIFNDGAYTKSLNTIDSYLASEKPKYIVKIENGTIIVSDAEEKDFEDSNVIIEKEENEKPSTEITNDNYVEEQRKSTEKQVEKADQEKVEGTNYPIFADNAGQKYLALNMIQQNEMISVKAFPEYQNMQELLDDILYVWYQNPYIMGIDVEKSKYDYKNQNLQLVYNVSKSTAKLQQEEIYKKSKEIINSIIKNNMTDEEKIFSIYKYLEDNSEYNHEAYDYAMSGANDVYQKYPNSWNTYGILCEKKGVCQSYAYAFNLLCYLADIDSVMVTGAINNGGHAWNAVELNSKWYMVDTTNNSKSLEIPYWICDSSYDFIFKNGFRLDDGFVDGTDVSEYKNEDDRKDWYFVNGLMPKDVKELVGIWMKGKNGKNPIVAKYQIETRDELNELYEEFVYEAKLQGVSMDELIQWNIFYRAGVISLKK